MNYYMKNITVALKQIGPVQMGYPFRSRLEGDIRGNVRVIQMKDITEDGRFDSDNLIRTNLNHFEERHLIKIGDIVLRSRGQTYKCALINEDTGIAVVTAPLLVVRISGNSVLPAYLAWYINQSTAQNYLTSHARGTSIPMVSKQVVERLPVTIPSIKCQQSIVNLSDMIEKEQDLLKQLSMKRQQYLSQLLLQILQGGSNE
jgi:restriction endonuclease S subunit